MIGKQLREKVGDLRQLASVRRITLDDGVERGVRALAFSNGSGLDFWALSDRSLDIGPLWWKGMPIAWQSMAGFRNPALHHAEEDGGRGFSRSFSGFVVTTGLDHIRQPLGPHPLHGRFPFTPAQVTAYGEDWDREEPVLFCEGDVTQFKFGGEALRLRRRIEVPIGGNEVRITDRVQNLAAQETPQASLYHFNLGYPAIAPGSTVTLGSRELLRVKALPDAADDPQSISYLTGDIRRAVCTVSTPTEDGKKLDIAFAFATDTLPHLQIWHDFRPHACVLGIEPCTSARALIPGPEKTLKPDEMRQFELSISFASGPTTV
jgi:hypothetical protein